MIDFKQQSSKLMYIQDAIDHLLVKLVDAWRLIQSSNIHSGMCAVFCQQPQLLTGWLLCLFSILPPTVISFRTPQKFLFGIPYLLFKSIWKSFVFLPTYSHLAMNEDRIGAALVLLVASPLFNLSILLSLSESHFLPA